MLETDLDDEIEKRVGTGPKYPELAISIGSAEGQISAASAAATTQRHCSSDDHTKLKW